MSVDPALLLGGPGALFARGMVERKTLAHIVTWMVPYIAEIERQNQIEARSLPVPRSYDIKAEFRRLPEQAFPYITVISPGSSPGRPPRREGDGKVTAWWVIAVGAVVQSRSMQEAKDLAGFYGAAIRGLMTQIPELGNYHNEDDVWIAPWAAGVEWSDERYDDWPPVEERTTAAVRSVFTIEVEDVINVFSGFRNLAGEYQLPGDPYVEPEPYPSVKYIDVEVDGAHSVTDVREEE